MLPVTMTPPRSKIVKGLIREHTSSPRCCIVVMTSELFGTTLPLPEE